MNYEGVEYVVRAIQWNDRRGKCGSASTDRWVGEAATKAASRFITGLMLCPSGLAVHLILQPLALLLLPALCNSTLLVCNKSRQLNDVMVASEFAGTINEYECRSLHSASHSSIIRKSPLNSVRMT